MSDLEDFSRFGDRLQRELERVDRHHEVDLPHVKRYVQKIDGTMTDGSMAEYLKNLRLTSKRLEDKPISKLSEPDMEAHVYELRHSPEFGQGDEPGLSDATVRNVEHAVRHFLERLELAEWAEDYDVTPQPDTKVRPEDMLEGEDIASLRDGANNMRDIALIEFLADSGARLSLAGTLRVRDVDLDSETATYTPNPNAKGLKGAAIQPYPIIDAKSTLRSYLRSTHPRPDEPNVAFFHKIPGHGNTIEADDDGALSPDTIRTQLRKAAEKGGVGKPVNPHNFRHSAVTRMRREGYDRAEVEHRVHWRVDTDMWQVYEHISGAQHNEAIFAAAGIAESEDGPDASRAPCANCTEPIAPHHDFCPKCGEPVSHQARQAKGKAVDSITGQFADIRSPTRQEIRAKTLRSLDIDARPLDAHDDSPST